MWEYIILGIIQGITEWFPVSSSGHLVFLQNFLIIDNPIFFDILVHFASLLVILAVFWKDIFAILKSPFNEKFKDYRKYWGLIPIGTMPAVIVGFAFQDQIESLFTGFTFLSFTFLFTGIVLLLSKYRAFKDLKLSPPVAFGIGVAQALALAPGISRSGMTICVALILGLSNKEAGRFAFLLAIPAIGGAFLLQLLKVDFLTINLVGSALGFFAAFVVGIVSLKLLLGILNRGKMHYFAVWLFFMAVLAAVL